MKYYEDVLICIVYYVKQSHFIASDKTIHLYTMKCMS
jgi:hypothetical protein